MKILVAIKRVLDHNQRVRINSDGSGVDVKGAKMSINPFDEIALEAALRLRESGAAKHVRAISIGSDAVQDSLRSALAFGADDAVLIHSQQVTQPLGVAKALCKYLDNNDFDLILMGKQAIDDDANQTGQMTAALLDWPQATFASNIVLDGSMLRVEREIDGGIEVIELPLPAVITTDLRLNQPRFIALPNIMKAKKKPLSVIENGYAELLQPRILTRNTRQPEQRKAGKLVANVDQLIAELKRQGTLV